MNFAMAVEKFIALVIHHISGDQFNNLRFHSRDVFHELWPSSVKKVHLFDIQYVSIPSLLFAVWYTSVQGKSVIGKRHLLPTYTANSCDNETTDFIYLLAIV